MLVVSCQTEPREVVWDYRACWGRCVYSVPLNIWRSRENSGSAPITSHNTAYPDPSPMLNLTSLEIPIPPSRPSTLKIRSILSSLEIAQRTYTPGSDRIYSLRTHLYSMMAEICTWGMGWIRYGESDHVDGRGESRLSGLPRNWVKSVAGVVRENSKRRFQGYSNKK